MTTEATYDHIRASRTEEILTKARTVLPFQIRQILPADVVGFMLEHYNVLDRSAAAEERAGPQTLRAHLKALQVKTQATQELLDVLQAVYRRIDDHDYNFVEVMAIADAHFEYVEAEAAALGICITMCESSERNKKGLQLYEVQLL